MHTAYMLNDIAIMHHVDQLRNRLVGSEDGNYYSGAI